MGTRERAKARREGSMSVMDMGWAPEARAARRATRPMGPAPWMETGLPMESFVRDRAWRITLRGSRRAAWEKVTESGSLWIQFAEWVLKRWMDPLVGWTPEKATDWQRLWRPSMQR